MVSRRGRDRLAPLFGLLAACSGEPLSGAAIPPGLFANPTGEQTVKVSEEALAFHILLTGPRAGQVFDRSYSYRLRGGRLEPYPVRDADAVFGIGAFTWTWNGDRIVQHDRGTGAVLQEFSRIAAGG